MRFTTHNISHYVTGAYRSRLRRSFRRLGRQRRQAEAGWRLGVAIEMFTEAIRDLSDPRPSLDTHGAEAFEFFATRIRETEKMAAWSWCPACKGTGEQPHMTRCLRCNGLGGVPS